MERKKVKKHKQSLGEEEDKIKPIKVCTIEVWGPEREKREEINNS
jgi:hypothetical protein